MRMWVSTVMIIIMVVYIWRENKQEERIFLGQILPVTRHFQAEVGNGSKSSTTTPRRMMLLS